MPSVTFQYISPERKLYRGSVHVCVCAEESVLALQFLMKGENELSFTCLFTYSKSCVLICYTDVTSTHYHSESVPPAMPDCTCTHGI